MTNRMPGDGLTTVSRWSSEGRRLLAWLVVACGITACSRNQASPGTDLPSAEEAWVASACTPAHPDFSAWTRRRVGGVTVAAPPGYEVLQGPPTNILFQGPARRSSGMFQLMLRNEARTTFDSYRFRQRQKTNVCRGRLSGYPADVIGMYDRGQYMLVAFWEATWGGEDAGKWLMATIRSPRIEEATELRAILHTMRPASNGR
jgi:hypothetical protein